MDFYLKPLSTLNMNSFFCKRLQKLVGNRIIDLLLHMPNYFIQRKKVSNINEINTSGNYVFTAKVISHEVPLLKKSPYRIICKDNTDVIILNFFHYNSGYMHSLCPIGKEITISGDVEIFNKYLQINHPDKIILGNNINLIPEFDPVYPLTAGITNQMLKNIIFKLIQKLPEVKNWIPDFPTFSESIYNLHTNPNNKIYIERLSIDELLSIRAAIAILKAKNNTVNGKIINCNVDISDFVSKIPFKLSDDQVSALNDIKSDLQSNSAMNRLLQGDVGSGKTIVAIISTMYAIKNDMQVAYLAPTEILARQVYKNYCKIFNELDCELFLHDIKKNRNLKNQRLKQNQIKIAIGTHALIQDDVNFYNLGLVIIDEQHKFGVKQRSDLIQKGSGANILYMSATPIPRTLMRTINGDMDISIIINKPLGRLPIITSVITSNKIPDLLIKLQSIKDSKIYWVCPLIETSEKLDLKAAKFRYEFLNEKFPGMVFLVHGKMKNNEKETAMSNFQMIGFKILVSTTVIEVGIDVPDANIIVIEHAERFGMAQLHQLRGRVGRSNKQSYCILVYDNKLASNIAIERLKFLKNSQNGFEIAEKDLELRGSGDLIGKEQTGMPTFKIFDPTNLTLFKKLDKINFIKDEEVEQFYLKVFEKVITE